jgi:hypothetical protein
MAENEDKIPDLTQLLNPISLPNTSKQSEEYLREYLKEINASSEETEKVMKLYNQNKDTIWEILEKEIENDMSRNTANNVVSLINKLETLKYYKDKWSKGEAPSPIKVNTAIPESNIYKGEDEVFHPKNLPYEDKKKLILYSLKEELYKFYREVNATEEQQNKVNDIVNKYGLGTWAALEKVAEKRGYPIEVIHKYRDSWKEKNFKKNRNTPKPEQSLASTLAEALTSALTPEPVEETSNSEDEEAESKLEAELKAEEENVQTTEKEETPPSSKKSIPKTAKVKTQTKPREKQTRKKIYKQPQTIEEWAKARKLYPDLYTYTESGDLKSAPIQPNDLEKVIVIPSYQPATPQHMKEFFETKRAEVVEPATDFSKARRRLNEMIEAYKAGQISKNDILDFNQQVHQAECRINEVLKMPRKIINLSKFTTIKMSDVSFKWHEHTHTISDDVFMAEYTTIPIKSLWMPKPVQESEPQEGGAENTNVIQEDLSHEGEKKKKQIGAIIGRRKAMAFAGM